MKTSRSRHLAINGEKGIKVLTTRQDRFAVIGASFPVSVENRACDGDRKGLVVFSSVTLMPEKGEDGVIAVFIARYGLHLIIPVFWKEQEGNHYVSLDEDFIPRPTAVLQAFDSFLNDHMRPNLALLCGDVVYTTDPNAKTKPGGKTKKYVNDPDLLCRCAVGTASVEEVEAVAQKTEQEAEEIVQLRNELQVSEERLKKIGDRLGTLQGMYDQVKSSQSQSYPFINNSEIADALYELFRSFNAFREESWFSLKKRSSWKAVLAAHKAAATLLRGAAKEKMERDFLS